MNRLTAYLGALTVAAAATIALAQGRVRASSNSGLPLVANPQALPSSTDPGVMAQAVIDRGLAALKAKQNPDGGWQGPNDPPAMTAIVLKAFVDDPNYDAKTDFVKKGYDKLLSYQLESGGIYQDLLANYNTAIAISSLAAAEEPSFKPRIDKALAYLKGLQWTEAIAGPKGEKIADDKNPWYGGFGYGRSGRPDGSNMQVALDALHDAGLKPEDPAFKAAVKFASRLQNQSETNDQPWAGDDGGFVYSPAAGGSSPAGETKTPDGRRGLRSYGSMTYAGLKSMIYAGLTKDDPRVKAAWDWITRNWTLNENPGMKLGDPAQAQSGLYYYYHTLARALNAYDQPTFTDPTGKTHDWRVELIAKLKSLQKEDGTWSGDKRWMEDNPTLVTAYAILALQEAQQDLKEHPAK